MKHKLLLLYSWFVRSLLFFMPDMPLTMRLRGFLYSLGMKKCGKNFQVTSDAWLKELENLEVGNNCFVGNFSWLTGNGKIIIGDNVLIGPHVILISGNHKIRNGTFNSGVSEYGVIKIGSGSWLAANCSVVCGAELPESSLLAANSFLNKVHDTPMSLYGGAPAKFIKKL